MDNIKDLKKEPELTKPKLKVEITKSPIDKAIRKALDGIVKVQDPEGFWCYELEADITIPSEYILMMHYIGDVDKNIQAKMANYIRKRQQENGGWPLYLGGKTDISCTVKAYYALKLAGDDIESTHMLLARRAILEKGGAAKSNVFTRIMLAMFEQVPWRAVPFIPVEIMLMPKWFPFHISKISYWSRTVIVPLFVLYSFRATAKNPGKIDVRELFEIPPEKERNYFPKRSLLNKIILIAERIGFNLQGLIPGFIHKRALEKAKNWMLPRLNGESGLGAIFPAMINAYEALLLLGYEKDDEVVKMARKSIDLLIIEKDDEAYCQPCMSPIWDTLLVARALLESKDESAIKSMHKGLEWLQKKQVVDGEGDWRENRPNLAPGGWPFQFNNDYYPDLDDTAFVGLAMAKADFEKYEKTIKLAADWIVGLQSKNGGFASFELDNTQYYLNEIPFADHGALLDPPTADVTARCVMFLASIVIKYPEYQDSIDKGLQYLDQEQEDDGSWFGRWGTNYIYGTWSVLLALEELKIKSNDGRIKKAVAWLKSVQRKDGGWGEDNDSYESFGKPGLGYKSSAFQTAWAILGLMSAGEAASESVSKGIDFLLKEQDIDGLWHDPEHTAPGFPRVFYLKYHGYDKYFPLWALSKYRNEIKSQRQ
ncbi:MAG: squalene--hopene cyclase [Flavobacteriaceae bacterium]|nr:squalene--hopene cyclase [Flavobacteriaceae bacterium]